MPTFRFPKGLFLNPLKYLNLLPRKFGLIGQERAALAPSLRKKAETLVQL
jgi:hypothetical protein